MADVNLKNLARMTVSSSGTGTITLNTAVTGFLTFDLAGCSTAAAGSIVRYAISDTTKSEFAYGTYSSSSLTLTRGSSTTGMKSTNADSPIDMSNAAQVFITDSYADHPFIVDTTGSPITYTYSQDGATAAMVSNTNAGASASANLLAVYDAGSLRVGATGSGGTSVGIVQWTGSGAFYIDALNATGNIAVRTGAGPTNALTVSSTQAVAIPGTLAVTGNSGVTNSQNGATTFTVSNTNAGAAASANFIATVDAGSLTAKGNSTANGGTSQILWSGAGSFLVDAQNAAGNIALRTGAGPTNALTISAAQVVAIPSATASISTATGALVVTGGLGVGGAVFADKFSATSQPCFSAHKNGVDQVGLLSANFTKVTAGTEDFDIGSYYDAATSRWTPPAGLVQIKGAAVIQNTLTTGGAQILAIYRNGVKIAETRNYAASTVEGLSIDVLYRANGAEFFELFVYGTASVDFDVNGSGELTRFQGFVL